MDVTCVTFVCTGCVSLILDNVSFACVSISIYSNFFCVLGSVTYCTCECLYAFFCTGGILCYDAVVPLMTTIDCEGSCIFVTGLVCCDNSVIACFTYCNAAFCSCIVECYCYVKVICYGNNNLAAEFTAVACAVKFDFRLC